MRKLRLVLVAVSLIGLAACSSPTKFKSYSGPEITHVVVDKGKRRMYLMHNDEVQKSYAVGLGFAPDGHKAKEGDGKTPEGEYWINRRNPNSKYHLSLGISYPNARDASQAAMAGQSPGGEIFIHGRPKSVPRRLIDWTAGCIAISDREIEEAYAMVKNGTPIVIQP